MLDYKFHHLSSRFTAGWKTEEEKREKTEGESMKMPQKWRTTARGKGIKRERRERKGAKQTEKWKKERQKERKPVLCRVGSELSLVPAFLWHSIRQEAV